MSEKNFENPFKKISEEEKNSNNPEKTIDDDDKNVKNIKKKIEENNFSKQIPTIEENKDKKNNNNNNNENKKSKKSFLWFFVWFLILSIFASVLLIFILVIWWPDNPLLDLLWIQAAQIQTSLLNITQTVFSIFSIWIFAIGSVFLFLWILKKTDKNKFYISSWIFWWLLFLTVVIWLWLYNYINWFNFWLNIKAEIEVQLHDWSKDLSKVVTPAILDFSILNWILSEEKLWKEVESIFWDFNDDWDFDDKWINEKMSHEFNTPWNKKIIAVLNFKDWTSQTYEKVFNIKDWSFWADIESWTAPLKIVFNTNNIVDNSKNAISEFRWYFDGWENPDLITSNTVIEHIFKKVWKYNVVLVVVDIKNNIKKYNKIIEVVGWNWSSNLISNISIFPSEKWTAPFKVRLSWENSLSKKWEITSYTWNFWAFEKEISWKDLIKTFDKIWTYNIKLTIENEYWEKNFSTKTILVTWKEEAPVAKISTNLKSTWKKWEIINFNVPFNMELDWLKSTDWNNDIIKYSWDFDWDWIPDAFWEKVKKDFREVWEYKITLIVEDSQWNKWEEILEINWEESVKAIISTDKESWVAPLVVLFDASFSRVDTWDKIVNYSWNFWDWSISEFSSAQKRHRFEDPWVYSVALEIFTENWKTYKSNKKIFIREESVQACFSISKTETNTDSEIWFSSQCSSWEIKNWNWDFWDWKISYQRNPVHSFKNPWNYMVILQITDYKNNVSEFRKEVEIK